MSWTTPSDLQAEVRKWWERGDLLAETLVEQSSFPRRLKFKTPTSAEITDKFSELRAWVAAFKQISHFRIETREFNHRVYGKNSIPSAVYVDTLEDALTIVGKRKQMASFTEIALATKKEAPELLHLLRKDPHKVLGLSAQWCNILKVVKWIQRHPKPEIYIRQVDIPGIDTKFIETYNAIIADCLETLLPAEAINQIATGTDTFARRYGFKEKPDHIRFRLRDARRPFGGLTQGEADIKLDVESFSNLCLDLKCVFITENEINFLSFPLIERSMVIFGFGYGFESLSKSTWLLNCDIYYWGDIDTHGYAILSSLRAHFPQVQSLLMDEATIREHLEFSVTEESPLKAAQLPYLTREEQDTYLKMKTNHFGPNLRIEQELLKWSHVSEAIEAALALRDSFKTRPNTPFLVLGDTDLRRYLNPSPCVLRTRLYDESLEETDFDPLRPVLRTLQQEFKQDEITKLPCLFDLRTKSDADAIALTLHAIAEKAPVIVNPRLSVEVILRNSVVKIDARADLLLLEQEQYIARNFRIGHMSGANDSVASACLQLFQWVYSKTQDTALRCAEIYNSDRNTVTVSNDGGRSILHKLNKILDSKLAEKRMYEPVSYSKCISCEFKSNCWKSARENDDVAILPGVDQELAIVLHNEGITSTQQVLEKLTPSILANVKRRFAGKIQKVGNRAKQIIGAAHAFTEMRPVIVGSFDFEVPQNYIIIDFEGIPNYTDSLERIFLWGIQVFSSGGDRYIPIPAGMEDENDCSAWESFLIAIEQIFAEFGDDVPILHWHNYEMTKMDLYIQRYGDPNGVALKIKEKLVDLLPLVRSFVALPCSSYSLKEVEKLVGFIRTQSLQSGTACLAELLTAHASKEGERYKACLREIIAYNKEDILSTNAILKWVKTLI